MFALLRCAMRVRIQNASRLSRANVRTRSCPSCPNGANVSKDGFLNEDGERTNGWFGYSIPVIQPQTEKQQDCRLVNRLRY